MTIKIHYNGMSPAGKNVILFLQIPLIVVKAGLLSTG